MLTTGPHVRFIERHTQAVLRKPLVRAIKAYRNLTREARVLPDFIIFGARKCGTTSLYEYLARHPQVLPALSKELFYFDYHYEKGTAWYRRHFPTRIEKWIHEDVLGRTVVTGEATPSYFYEPQVAKRIAKLLPNVKLILLLREPVATAYSSYQFGIKGGSYTAQEVVFEKVIREELDYIRQGGELFSRHNGSLSINPKCTYLARHAYIELMKPWFEVFDKSQIKTLISEDLFAHPAKVYKEVQTFLGLSHYELTAYNQFNGNSYGTIDALIEARLEQFFAPFNDDLSKFLDEKISWRPLGGVGELGKATGSFVAESPLREAR